MQLINKKQLFHDTKVLAYTVSGEASFDIQNLLNNVKILDVFVKITNNDTNPFMISLLKINEDGSTTLLAEQPVSDESYLHLVSSNIRYLLKIVGNSCQVEFKILCIQ